jgi:ABC-2 type transport system ATP-binding protein
VELRQTLWQFIRRLNREGHTILLTTHYLEEAEELCSRVAMLKQGEIVALDTTENLLNRFRDKYVTLRLESGELPASARAMVVSQEKGEYRLQLPDYVSLEPLLAQIRNSGATIKEMQLAQPDLEDVFVSIMNKQS